MNFYQTPSPCIYNSNITSHFQTNKGGSNRLLERFNVAHNVDTLLLFQEDTDKPAASLAMADLPTETIINVIENHQFLRLPRLSSQEVFDSLCPSESSRTRKRLCVVLFTRDDPEHEQQRQALREFIQNHRWVSFAVATVAFP